MCHSFTICSYQELERALRALSGNGTATPPEDVRTGGVAYPGTFVPVFVFPKDDEPSAPLASLFDLEVEEMGFGWPVEWKKQGTVFNARLESLLQGGAHWGDAILARRCILPCESFFESHLTEADVSPKTGRPIKRRYLFHDPEGKTLLLGAVYEGECFSVVTTEPNVEVAPIHDRMPLVLTMEEARLWLDPSTPLERIASLADRASIELSVAPAGAQAPAATQLELDL